MDEIDEIGNVASNQMIFFVRSGWMEKKNHQMSSQIPNG